MSWPRFGIKTGNSTLCIAYARSDGKYEIIANKQGDRTSQACLLWDKEHEIECGLTAKQKMALRPKQAVAHSFQLLQDELSAEQLDEALSYIPCEYDRESGKFQLTCQPSGGNDNKNSNDCHKLSVSDVHVHLLRAELELARQYHLNNEQKPLVVLSIPSYYKEPSWQKLGEIAEAAGFQVAQIITEPTSALLAYNLDVVSPSNDASEKYALTIKSGGLFSHFALYRIQNGLFSMQEEYGPFTIGGKNYTEALVQFICDEFQRKYKLDPSESRRTMAKIRTVAANCKHILSTLPSTQIYIDSLMDGVDFNAQMSRARFDSLIQPVINQFMQTLQNCVQHVKQIDSIVLLGATMQIPKLQAAIAARFPQAQLLNSIPSDEVVAVGCARQATLLIDPEKKMLSKYEELTLCMDKITIWHGENAEQAQVVVDKGTVIPKRVQINVPTCSKTNNKHLFTLCAGEEQSQVSLQNAKINQKSQMYCLEVELLIQKHDDQPLIRLHCI